MVIEEMLEKVYASRKAGAFLNLRMPSVDDSVYFIQAMLVLAEKNKYRWDISTNAELAILPNFGFLSGDSSVWVKSVDKLSEAAHLIWELIQFGFHPKKGTQIIAEINL